MKIGRRAAILTNQVFDWLTKEETSGGGERYTRQLARLLSSLGYDVVVYQLTMTLPYTKTHKDGFSVVAYQPKTAWPERELCDEFYLRTGDCDLHIITMPEYAVGKKHLGTVLTIQGSVWFGESAHDLSMSDNGKYRMRLALTGTSSLVLTHSYYFRPLYTACPDCAGFLFDNNRIFTIDHGIDTDVFCPGVGTQRANLVLFPGRAELVKGVKTYLEIERVFNNPPYDNIFSVSWCGSGSYDSEIKNRMRFSHDEMPSAYRSARTCCVINSGEIGNSLALLEAMSSGCACVVCSSGQNAIINGENGLCTDSFRASEIAAMIWETITFPDLAVRLGENARETILNKYSMSLWNERWSELIEETNSKNA